MKVHSVKPTVHLRGIFQPLCRSCSWHSKEAGMSYSVPIVLAGYHTASVSSTQLVKIERIKHSESHNCALHDRKMQGKWGIDCNLLKATCQTVWYSILCHVILHLSGASKAMKATLLQCARWQMEPQTSRSSHFKESKAVTIKNPIS